MDPPAHHSSLLDLSFRIRILVSYQKPLRVFTPNYTSTYMSYTTPFPQPTWSPWSGLNHIPFRLHRQTKWVEIPNILGSYCQMKVSRVMKYSLNNSITLSKRLKESSMARGSWHRLDVYGCHYGDPCDDACDICVTFVTQKCEHM